MATMSSDEKSNQKNGGVAEHKATAAAEPLLGHLGLQAEAVFSLANPASTSLQILRTGPRNTRLFKDVIEYGIRGEAQKIQLQVIDSNGSVVSESESLFPLSDAVDLLRMLPLPLSPTAPQWLKECLSGDCQGQSRTSQAVCIKGVK